MWPWLPASGDVFSSKGLQSAPVQLWATASVRHVVRSCDPRNPVPTWIKYKCDDCSAWSFDLYSCLADFIVDPGLRGVTKIMKVDSGKKHSSKLRRECLLEAQSVWSKLSHGRGRVPHLLRPRGGAAHLAVSLPRFIGGRAFFLLARVTDGSCESRVRLGVLHQGFATYGLAIRLHRLSESLTVEISNRSNE